MTDTDNTLISSIRYQIWGWPAAVNLILGGTAAGFYLFSLLNTELYQPVKTALPLIRYNMVSPILVAAGFLTVGIETGSPLRGIYLLHHIKKSWMSREVLTGLIFIIVALADWVHPQKTLKILGTLTAAGLLICQGFMVFRAMAVAAWEHYLIPCYFVASGLAIGFGSFLIWSAAITEARIPLAMHLLGLICLSANLVVWYLIAGRKTDPVQDSALLHLREPFSMTLSIGFGHIVPILLVITIAILHAAGHAGNATLPLYLITGLCVLAGGVIQKIALILQANALHTVKPGQPMFHEHTVDRLRQT